MATNKNPSLKDPHLYAVLRDDGASQQKAARISNAAAKEGRSALGRKGGKSPAYEEWTVAELRAKAKEMGLKAYSTQRKAALIESLRNS
ncbi:SAP domain-containing protein [Arthrobacter sp. HLT1-20]